MSQETSFHLLPYTAEDLKLSRNKPGNICRARSELNHHRLLAKSRIAAFVQFKKKKISLQCKRQNIKGDLGGRAPRSLFDDPDSLEPRQDFYLNIPWI